MNPARRADSAFAIAESAIANANRIPVTREQIVEMLRTGKGRGSHLRALFGDVDAGTLLRIAVAQDIASRELWKAYLRAREAVAAKSPDFEEWAAGIF